MGELNLNKILLWFYSSCLTRCRFESSVCKRCGGGWSLIADMVLKRPWSAVLFSPLNLKQAERAFKGFMRTYSSENQLQALMCKQVEASLGPILLCFQSHGDCECVTLSLFKDKCNNVLRWKDEYREEAVTLQRKDRSNMNCQLRMEKY